jgi:hypothetical protein
MTAIECHLQVLRTPASPREWGEFGLNDCTRLQSVRHECGWRRCGHDILRPLQSGAPCLSAHRGGGGVRVKEGSELVTGASKNPEIGNLSIFRILIPNLVSKVLC